MVTIAFSTITGYFDQNIPKEEAVMERYQSLAQNQLLLRKEYQTLNDKVHIMLPSKACITDEMNDRLPTSTPGTLKNLHCINFFQVYEAERELASLKDFKEREIMVHACISSYITIQTNYNLWN